MAFVLQFIGTGTAGNAGSAADLSVTTFTVPANEYWIPRCIRVKYISTSTVTGNRSIGVYIFGNSFNYGLVYWVPTQAANLTRYYSAWEGASQSAAFVGTSYAQGTLAQDGLVTGGFAFSVQDLAGYGQGRNSFLANSVSAVDATTLTATSAEFESVDRYLGYTLVAGGSTAVITGNTDTILTFSGGWTGGTPTLPLAAPFYLYADTAELTVAYDKYQKVIV